MACQNWDIAQRPAGREVEPRAIADMMLELQRLGCHNVNFVTPSHVVAQIIAAVSDAAQRGLALPLVYNTSGYDSLEALALLDGIVDIYMPDMKYADSRLAHQYSKVRNYVAVNRAAVKEMHRQVGDLVLDARGIAQRGLLVRHLVLPNRIAGTRDVLRFLAEEISRDTYLNLMDQYQPYFHAREHPALARPLTQEEYREALAAADEAGLERLDQRLERRRLGSELQPVDFRAPDQQHVLEHPRHPLHRLLVFEAVVVDELGVDDDRLIQPYRPRLRVGLRIVDRDLDVEVSEARTADALGHTRLCRNRAAGNVEPVVTESDRLDDERVTLPAA